MIPIVPEGFDVPREITTDKFKLRISNNSNAILTFEALMSSIDHLQGVFDPNDQPWPTKDLTPQDVWSVSGRGEWDYSTHASFQYAVINLDETVQLGEVIIDGAFNEEFDARVVLWVRKSEYEKGFDSELFKFVKKWLEQDWPLEKIAYPGRDHDWADFSRPKFLDDDLEIPDNIEAPGFTLQLLTLERGFIEDYHACNNDNAHIRGVFGPGTDWPSEEPETLETHLHDLGYGDWSTYHRRSLCWAAFDPKTGRQRGCVYVFPTQAVGYDCEIYTWVTGQEFRVGFDSEMFNWVRAWIEETDLLPFKNIASPGREIHWDEWYALPKK